MSETKIDLPKPEQTEAPQELSRKDALLGSMHAVKECQRLIRGGHFAGSRAGKITMCLGYLEALEHQIKAQLQSEK